MRDKVSVPKHNDPTELPGGGKLGRFWTHCKSLRRCRQSPYDQLLDNSLLKADYRGITNGTRERRSNHNER